MKDFGILVPIVTPCTRSGEIDAEGLRKVCTEMLDAGCAGIFAASSTGRGPWFTAQRRADICRIVADHVGDRASLFSGCMATGLPAMLENARMMADAGAQFVVVTAPPYYGYSQAEIEKSFLHFADGSPVPVMIYDIPAFAGMKLDIAPVLKLARHPNVVAFKDSSADFDRFEKIAAALGDVPDFWLFQGKEHQLAKSLLGGASGFIVSLIHIHPELFVGLYRAARDRDVEKAHSLQDRVTRVFELVDGAVKRRPETSTLFHILGEALRRRGLCDNLLLEHEGEAPEWLVRQVDRILDVAGEKP